MEHLKKAPRTEAYGEENDESINSVWSLADNPERYAELFGGAQQWGGQMRRHCTVTPDQSAGSCALWSSQLIVLLRKLTRQ